MEKPDFFRKGFVMQRKLFCTKCSDITLHQIQVLKDSPEDGGVPTLKTCLDCYEAYEKLKAIGVDKGHPVLFQRFLTAPWVFLVIKPDFLE